MKAGTKALVRLHGHYNNYSWGKMGHNSEVARLFQAGHGHFTIDPDQPYSELWMGTHPDGPARLMEDIDLKLSSFIARHKEQNNNNQQDSNSQHLPFIMKVMSIERTLSLQVHPTKEQAVELHRRDPANYPDMNHKPELAYALTRFQLLCGFRPHLEMLRNLECFSSLKALFGPQAENLIIALRSWSIALFETELVCRDLLKKCFAHMMNVTSREMLNNFTKMLFDELQNGVRGSLKECTVEVMKRMRIDFPGDVGVFSPLILNHMILEPGECCYYAAQELHAYISGECVECVGCSNNTIRAAMTPKFIDREALVECIHNFYLNIRLLTIIHPIVRTFNYTEYDTDLPPLDCGSIIVIHTGRAILEEEPLPGINTNHYIPCMAEVKRGDIYYIQPGRRLKLTNCTEDLEAFQTFSFEEGPDHESRTVVGIRSRNGIDFEPLGAQSFEEGRLRKVESGILVDELEADGFI